MTGATTYYYYDGEWSELGSRDIDGCAGMGNLRNERERMSQKPILEQGATSATNVYGLGVDENVIRFEPANVYYFYQDHEGSVTHVRAVTTGATIESYRYDAFGQPTIRNANGTQLSTSAINNRFMFTGREWAPMSFGFYEYRARAYHPGLGRFMSEDPKGFAAGDYNLYRYCGNDPEDRVDPMGLNAIFSASGDWARIANNGENIGGESGGGSSGGSAPNAAQAGGGSDARAAERGSSEPLNVAFIGINQAPKELAQVRKYLAGTPLGKSIERAVNDPVHRYDVVKTSGYPRRQQDTFKAGGGIFEIKWNPLAARTTNDGRAQSPAIVIGHEFDHGNRYFENPSAFGPLVKLRGNDKFGTSDDRRIITGPEARTARLLHEGVRTDGAGRFFGPVASPTSNGDQ